MAHCRGGIYVAMSSSELDVLQAAFRRRWQVVDVHHLGQEHLHAGPRRLPAPVRADPVRLARGRNATGVGDRDQGDVWNIKKPQKNDLHPTMKPVELVERAIRNSSRPATWCSIPFGGSGTTLIAAEKSGRVARLIELDPKYVDVIVRRWEDFRPAKQATREADGARVDQAAGRRLATSVDDLAVNHKPVR